MASIIHKLVHKAKRRIKGGRKDSRTHALFEAGIILLARQDYELVSIAGIVREAGCSVGAFYGRFPDKNAYLYQLIASAFHTLTDDANLVLDKARWPRASDSVVAHHIVSYVVTKLASKRASGVIRATIKLATVRPATLDLFRDYRNAVTERAVFLLAPRAGDRSSAVRAAMQIVFATVTDGLLQNGNMPLKANSKRMVDALTGVIVGCLDSSHTGQWAGSESDNEDSTENESEKAPDLPAGRMAVYDPSDRVYRSTAPSLHKPKRARNNTVKHRMATEGSASSRNSIRTRANVKPPRVPPSAHSAGSKLPKKKRRLI
ncbi:MAG TPA: TetR/AcrR family transcriptional regulator [Micropepsaceae bacterium]|nr:TetR/AcrR family transcriptional regulator [Micropepsaceae bacterium]